MFGSPNVAWRLPHILPALCAGAAVLALGGATALGVAWAGASAAGRIEPLWPAPALKVRHHPWFYSLQTRRLVEWHALQHTPGCGMDYMPDPGTGECVHGEAVADAFLHEAPRRMLDLKRATPRANYMRQIRAGWPLRCVEGLAWNDFFTSRTHPTFGTESLIYKTSLRAPFVGDVRVIAPLRPMPVGLVANSLVFAAPWTLVALTLGAGGRLGRRLLRLRGGRCPKCAYDLLHDFESGCPECGWNCGASERPSHAATPT